ncbi:hypothetical protein WJX74_008302 [Apatococcus lobatus]|uniref:Uncharacterized protein n=1 Tax=Apatococcus lobatus TaxID=904363 RepID=A0AAW1QKZ4_9CHLO
MTAELQTARNESSQAAAFFAEHQELLDKRGMLEVTHAQPLVKEVFIRQADRYFWPAGVEDPGPVLPETLRRFEARQLGASLRVTAAWAGLSWYVTL